MDIETHVNLNLPYKSKQNLERCVCTRYRQKLSKTEIKKSLKQTFGIYVYVISIPSICALTTFMSAFGLCRIGGPALSIAASLFHFLPQFASFDKELCYFNVVKFSLQISIFVNLDIQVLEYCPLL